MFDTKLKLTEDDWENVGAINPRPHTISTLLSIFNSKTRNWKLHPDFQRYDSTWTDDDRRAYIDSVEKDIAQISQIHITIGKNKNGNKDVYILDGGHRIDTIKRFCGLMGPKNMFADMHGRMYSDFNDDLKSEFGERRIQVVEYNEITNDQQSTIFGRINRALKFSPGEVINSLKTTVPMCNIADKLSKKYNRVLLDKHVGMYRLNEERQSEKCVVFAMVVNFAHRRMVMYERPGQSVEADIARQAKIPVDEDRVTSDFVKLMNMFDVNMSKKFNFYDMLVAQYIIMKEPTFMNSYKSFMRDVFKTNSEWYEPWVNAVVNNPNSDRHRPRGMSEKNLQARMMFFKEKYLNLEN
jgi:hypothetical protein